MAPRKIRWRVFRRLAPYLKPYWLPFAGSMLFLFAMSALTIAKALIIQPTVDTFDKGGATQENLLFLCVVVAAIFISQALCSWTYTLLSRYVGASMVRDIRNDLFAHLMRQHLGYFTTRSSADLTSRAVNDVAALDVAAVGAVQNLLQHTATVLFALAAMLWYDWQLALLSIGVVVIVGFVLRAAMKKIAVFSRRVQERLAQVARHLFEMIGGIDVILGFGLSELWRKHFRTVSHEHCDTQLEAQRVQATAISAVQIILGVGIAGIILATGSALLRGDITPGEFLAFLAMIYLLQGPAQQIGTAVSQLTRGLAAGERAFELFDDRPEITYAENPVVLEKVRGEIRFENVRFAYPRTSVISDLSFTVEPGELVVMVGDSGAGKSTVAKLLMRFYDPDRGRVLLDGVPLPELSRETLYRNVSYVPQEVFVFDETIGFNLRVGKPDATDEEVADAIRIACLTELIETLPEGLDTKIGERGVQLSGGQRQRVALARAILTDAQVLVLDEATSALDMDLEQRILQNLVDARRHRTIFAITHRLSLAEVADRVLVLKDGTLVEEGAAAVLAAGKGEYNRLRRASQAGLQRQPG